jgi:hypothetical protein
MRGISMRKILPFVFALVMGALLFSGCKNEDDDPGGSVSALIGEWTSGSDSYSIKGTTLNYTGYEGYSFESRIRYVYNFTGASGVVIVEYTTPPTAYTPLGNFQGVYYKELAGDTVKLGNAYTAADYTIPVEVETLAEAKEKFKLDNIALYGGELTMAVTQTR